MEVPAASDLRYPFEPPEPGRTLEVAEGVLWLRMPLPMALDHINLYLVADGDGWTLIDTGINAPVSEEVWERVIAEDLGGRPITRIICTHMHPDHIGMAGWLAERFNAPLFMTRLEYVTARMLVGDVGPAPEAAVRFYREAGWSEGALARYRERFGLFGRGVKPMPDTYTRMAEGDRIDIGGEGWRVILGCGHSPEHACLWNEARGLFISGDQVLPKISSIVAVWPTEPEEDPLDDWLASCRKLAEIVSPDVLTLPAHNAPFYGLHERLNQLITGHEVNLQQLETLLEEPKRVVDGFGALFRRKISGGLLVMATGETLAHLNYLRRRGRVERRVDDAGVAWYARVSA